MHVAELITVNWGNLPNRVYPLGPMTLFSGGSGSGKSTLADALQTVLTAAHGSVAHFNSAQSLSRQRGHGEQVQRTLESYILGADRATYSRPQGAEGYVAAVFRESPSETPRLVSAVIGARAYLESVGGNGSRIRRTAKLDDLVLLTVAGHALTLEDLLETGASGNSRVRPVLTLEERLKETCEGTARIMRHRDKKAYLTTLWGLLNGQSFVPEEQAKNAARAFVAATAYRPVTSIDDLVKNEILPENNRLDDIRALSDSVKDFHALEGQAMRVRERITALEGIEETATGASRQWIAQAENRTLAARAEQGRKESRLNWHQSQRAEAKLRAHSLDAGIERFSDAIAAIAAELDGLRRALDASANASRRKSLEDNRERAAQRYTTAGERVFRNRDGITSAVAALHAIAAAPPEVQSLPELRAGFERVPEILDLLGGLDADAMSGQIAQLARLPPEDADAAPLLSTLDRDLGNLEAALELGVESLLGGQDAGGQEAVLAEDVRRLRVTTDERIRSLASEQNKLERDNNELTQGRRASLPREVEDGLRLLKERLPQARPRVLCEVVEMAPSFLDWQNAIEGYLGGKRFVLLVDPNHEVEANRVLRSHEATLAQARLAKARADTFTIPPDSMLQALQVSDPVARDYLTAQYGAVVRVEAEEDLVRTPRSVMASGRASGGFTTYRAYVEDRALVFGESARRRRLQANLQRLAELQRELAVLNERLGRLDRLSNAFNRLQPPGTRDLVADMADAHREIQSIDAQLRAIVLTAEERDLSARMATLETEKRSLEPQRAEAYIQLGEAHNQIKVHGDKVDELTPQLAEAKAKTALFKGLITWLASVDDTYQADAFLDDLDARSSGPGGFEHAADTAWNGWVRLREQLASRLVDYNRMAGSFETIAYPDALSGEDTDGRSHYPLVCGLARSVGQELARQRAHVLADLEEQLGNQRQAIDQAFSSDLCLMLHNALREGSDIIQGLNAQMAGHTFGGDRIRFVADEDPELAAYARFFDWVAREDVARAGQTLADPEALAPEHRVIYEQLMKLLLSNEEQSQRELARLADYRRYRRFDLEVQTGPDQKMLLSEYATDSGGQSQVPVYFLRGVALAAAYRIQEGEGHRFRTILLDEALAQTDEGRTREVLRMLGDTFGLQVLVIMPTRGAGPIYPLLTHKITFSAIEMQDHPGEVKRVIHVKAERCDRAAITALWEATRELVATQAAFDFDSTHPPETETTAP